MILAAVAAGTSAETFTGLMDHVAQGFEALGAAILVVGVIWSFVLAAVAVRRSGWSAKAYLVLRQAFGGTLLLGLEILVAADLVRTVAVAPTLDNVLAARADRGDQDVPELLAGNRDRGRCAVAAGPDRRRGDDPPGLGQRAGVRDAAQAAVTVTRRSSTTSQISTSRELSADLPWPPSSSVRNAVLPCSCSLLAGLAGHLISSGTTSSRRRSG